MGGYGALCFRRPLRVRTHQQSRVESSPVQSSQTHKDAAVSLWLTYNGSSGSAYTPTESSRVESHESCRVKSLDAACSIFVSQTSDRA